MESVRKTFASDNYAGVHPEVMQALAEANSGHAGSYGSDPWTASAIAQFREAFGASTEVFFAYNGTGANVVGLSAITRSWNTVLCASSAHIQVDESTAPEKFTSCKLLPLPAPDGKLTPDVIRAHIQRMGDQHHPQPAVVSISQTTEYGTLYTADEIRGIADTAHGSGLLLHMDGARLSNAAAALGQEFRAFTRDAGVDVLSFGGTKNGLMFGEAVVIFDAALATHVPFIRKQGMQLHSKMRFISAQFQALLSNGLWLRNASHANKMAKRMEARLSGIPDVVITQPVQANALFAILPREIVPLLQESYPFYVWNEHTSEVRLMCSWDTTEHEVDDFADRLSRIVSER